MSFGVIIDRTNPFEIDGPFETKEAAESYLRHLGYTFTKGEGYDPGDPESFEDPHWEKFRLGYDECSGGTIEAIILPIESPIYPKLELLKFLGHLRGSQLRG